MIAATHELSPIPEHWPVGLREYHRDRTCESNSSLTAYAKDPYVYFLRYVKGCWGSEFSSPEQDFGTATHLGITVKLGLVDEDWAQDQVIVIPDDKTRDSAAGRKLKERSPGNPVLSNADVARCAAVVEGVFRDREARALLERGAAQAEHAIRWLHEPSGLGLKASFDLLFDDGLVVDIKTASNPRRYGYNNFEWAVRNYGYYRQAGLYSLGRDLYRPYLPEAEDDTGYKWLVVGTTPPYYVRIYSATKSTIALGQKHVHALLESLAARYEFGAECEDVWLPDDRHESPISIDERDYVDINL